MNLSVHPMNGTGTDAGLHAHLLAMELGGRLVRETPEEVMREIAFRSTHVSRLLEEMFREAETRNLVEVDERWD